MQKVDELAMLLPKDKSKEFFSRINDVIEEFAIDNNICPVCIRVLDEQKYKEYRGECHGFPSYETLYTHYCSNCGWQKE